MMTACVGRGRDRVAARARASPAASPRPLAPARKLIVRRTIWTTKRCSRGGSGGDNVASASKSTTASFDARSGGRAGRHTYANVLVSLKRHQEAKSLLHRQIPVARRVLGEGHEATLRMRTNYARALCTDEAATLDDLHKAVTTVEDVAQTARRVLGGAHPTTEWIERSLQEARARSTPARLATVKEEN